LSKRYFVFAKRSIGRVGASDTDAPLLEGVFAGPYRCGTGALGVFYAAMVHCLLSGPA
jgi:hypothetical protein